MTGGLRKVLQSAIERLAGKGGDPGHWPADLFWWRQDAHYAGALPSCQRQEPGDAAGPCRHLQGGGVATLPMRSKPVVFVGTAAGANQPIAIEGARTVKGLWGLIAVKLGGWKAYEKIKASDEARTNPGSEALIPILKEAAPCLILLDEVWRMRAISKVSPTTASSRSCSR